MREERGGGARRGSTSERRVTRFHSTRPGAVVTDKDGLFFLAAGLGSIGKVDAQLVRWQLGVCTCLTRIVSVAAWSACY